MKEIYNYNPITNEFIGTSQADESPLEKGVYLIPAYAVEIKPPTFEQGFIPVWNGTSWDIKDISLELPPEEDDNNPKEEKTQAEILMEENQKLKTRISALEDAILFLMDLGGM